jgi:peptidyl-prolyl cis-trans isomerase C
MKKVVLHLVTLATIIGLCGFGASKLFSEEKILARVGERVITQSDLDELLKRYEPFHKGGGPYSLDEKKRFLDSLIKNAIIGLEAEREKLNERPEFQAKLKMYKSELLVNEYITTKITPFISVTDEEVDELMKRSPNLVPKGTVTLKEILVKTEKEAEEIYQDLKKGADFSKIATEKSIAKSKTNGGLIGPISKEQIPPDLETLVSNLKEGEFSKPMKSDEGFRIYYLVNRKERSPQEIKMLEAKVRDKVFQLQKNQKIQAMMEKKVEELKKQIKVETYSDRLK